MVHCGVVLLPCRFANVVEVAGRALGVVLGRRPVNLSTIIGADEAVVCDYMEDNDGPALDLALI